MYVEYVVAVDPEIGEIVYCDLNCITRNLMNLVSNAAKQTAQGSITVEMTLEHQRAYIELVVRDTGVGVADEIKQSVFEPFVSMDDSTGLGLFVVRIQSEALGGSCGIRDNPAGPGAEVWFRVPYITTERDAIIGPRGRLHRELSDPDEGINVFGDVDGGDKPVALRVGEGNTRADSSANGEATTHVQSILLIDDNLSLLQVHAAELTQAGCTVTTALGGIQGLEFLKLKIYSLVLTDVKMPTLNGDELVAAFRHWESHNRPQAQQQTFYAMSAYTNQNVLERCQLVGMKGVVAKPLSIGNVVELLRKLHEHDGGLR